jgi:hypothetical protein
MSRHRYGHRHFNRFLVNLGKCAASRYHVTLDSRERSDVSDNEHRVVNVASRASLTHARAGTKTFRCEVDRFTITAINACLGLAVGTAVGLVGLRNAVHNTHEEIQPVGSAVRPFGEVSRAGTYFIWSPGSGRYSWGWRWSESTPPCHKA